MVSRLTHEQIEDYIETALLPHKANAKIHSFGAKIIVLVWSTKNGLPLLIFPSSLVHELQVEHFLKDWTGGLRREVNDIVEGRVS